MSTERRSKPREYLLTGPKSRDYIKRCRDMMRCKSAMVKAPELGKLEICLRRQSVCGIIIVHGVSVNASYEENAPPPAAPP